MTIAVVLLMIRFDSFKVAVGLVGGGLGADIRQGYGIPICQQSSSATTISYYDVVGGYVTVGPNGVEEIGSGFGISFPFAVSQTSTNLISTC